MDWRNNYEWGQYSYAYDNGAYAPPTYDVNPYDVDTVTKSIFQNAIYWYPSTNYCLYAQRVNDSSASVHAEKEKPQPVSPVAKQGSKKKQHWKSTAKNNFSHQFLATNLMGHNGKILGVDCSSDGKFLVSCADDEPPPDPGENSSSSSDGGKENRSPDESLAGSTPGSPSASRRPARRRRKPRSNKEQQRRQESPLPPCPGSLPRYEELQLNENSLASLLSYYVLPVKEMASLGYPVESASHPSHALIYSRDFTKRYDVNVPEFHFDSIGNTSLSRDEDSGQGSGTSSPRSPDSEDSDEDRSKSGVERRCSRCTRGFFLTNDGEYITTERCNHHWGRVRRVTIDVHMFDNNVTIPVTHSEWSCCGGNLHSAGCTRAPLHVWSGTNVGLNGPLDGFVRTKPRSKTCPAKEIVALDCEMCYTAAGLQVVRVEVIGADGRRVYGSYVRTDAPIIDYNTRFSGISAKHLQYANKTLKDVQNDLMALIDANTIVVGHGLENDLRALRILHKRVVDTAVSFPHSRGLPYRKSLKSLVQEFLACTVQENLHCPLEDARASLDLMLWRVQRDFPALYSVPAYN